MKSSKASLAPWPCQRHINITTNNTNNNGHNNDENDDDDNGNKDNNNNNNNTDNNNSNGNNNGVGIFFLNVYFCLIVAEKVFPSTVVWLPFYIDLYLHFFLVGI